MDMIHGLLESFTQEPENAIGYVLFILLLLLFPGIPFAGGLWILRWELDGVEIIEINSQSIRVHRKPSWCFYRQKTYLAEKMEHLRILPDTEPEALPGKPWVDRFNNLRFGGRIAFDYEGETARFGIDIDEAEAKRILDKIWQRFPQYEA